MNKILFLCSDFFNSADANGICVRNVIDKIIHQGYKVYVISEAIKTGMIYESNELIVFGVKKPTFMRVYDYTNEKKRLKWITNIFKLIRGVVVSIIYPNVSPIRARKVRKIATKLVTEQNICKVVGVYRPYESIWTLMSLKKKFNDRLNVIAYHLDLILEPNTCNPIIKKYKRFRGVITLKKEYKLVDKLILPESGEKIFDKENKVSYVDFPLFLNNNIEIENGFCYNNETINLVYIGSIDGDNRRIKPIANILNQINNDSEKKLVLHIWGSISDSVKQIVELNSYIEYHGFVKNKYTFYLLKKADFCVNISNRITYNMIPSKIFQYFAVGKPIINIIENEYDKSIKYFEKNRHYLNIYINSNDNETNISLIREYVKNYYKKRLSINTEMYQKSMPEYIVDIIL